MNDKELFDLFTGSDDRFDLCCKVESLIQKRLKDARGAENARFHDVLRRLSNSINNAGCEERRHEQIALINKESSHICEKYDDYLP